MIEMRQAKSKARSSQRRRCGSSDNSERTLERILNNHVELSGRPSTLDVPRVSWRRWRSRHLCSGNRIQPTPWTEFSHPISRDGSIRAGENGCLQLLVDMSPLSDHPTQAHGGGLCHRQRLSNWCQEHSRRDQEDRCQSWHSSIVRERWSQFHECHDGG